MHTQKERDLFLSTRALFCAHGGFLFFHNGRSAPVSLSTTPCSRAPRSAKYSPSVPLNPLQPWSPVGRAPWIELHTHTLRDTMPLYWKEIPDCCAGKSWCATCCLLFINELVHSQFKRGGVERFEIRLLIETFGSNLHKINNEGSWLIENLICWWNGPCGRVITVETAFLDNKRFHRVIMEMSQNSSPPVPPLVTRQRSKSSWVMDDRYYRWK